MEVYVSIWRVFGKSWTEKIKRVHRKRNIAPAKCNIPLLILSYHTAKCILGRSVRLPDEKNQALTFTYQWAAPVGFDPSQFDVRSKVTKVRNDYMEVLRSRRQSISAPPLAT
jgi:hypothetical protein